MKFLTILININHYCKVLAGSRHIFLSVARCDKNFSIIIQNSSTFLTILVIILENLKMRKTA